MTISLKKGGSISLKKLAPALSKIVVGLGWDAPSQSPNKFDLDAQCFILNESNTLSKNEDLIFFNNTNSQDGSIKHTGDNRTGVGEGDDESIIVDLTKINTSVKKLLFTVTIDEAIKRKQNFGKVKSAYVRLLNKETNDVLLSFDLDEDASEGISVLFCEINKDENGDWQFKALGQSTNKDFETLAVEFGFN